MLGPGFDPFQRARELERLLPAARIDAFELLEPLGAGGSARVFRARDGLGREVALKLLRPCAPALLERFRREAEATAALDHPHVVRVHSCGEFEGQPYLVTELVPECETLDLVLQRSGRGAGLELILQAARGLAHAHRRGVAHRDVKPDNLLVGEGRVRVADFGLALAEGDERLTRTGALLGTPGYLAPEQALGRVARELAPRCDVWALGVLTYRFLTGVAPHPASGALGCPTEPAAPRPARALDPSISPALSALCQRALEWDPRARFATADEFAQALEAARRAPQRGSRRLAGGAALASLALGAWLLGSGDRGIARLPQASPSGRLQPAEAQALAGARAWAAPSPRLERPRAPSALARRVELLLAWGAPQLALEEVRAARAADLPPASLELAEGRVLLELYRSREALERFERVRARSGESSLAGLAAALEIQALLQQGRLRPALSRARPLLERSGELPLQVFLALVAPLSERGVPIDLEPSFARASARLGSEPSFVGAWARYHAKRGRPAACDALLAEFTRRRGGSPELRSRAALACWEGGRFERALEELRRAGEAQGGSSPAWAWRFLRAEVYRSLGRLSEAGADLELLEAAGGPPSWRHAALRAEIELARGRYAAALEAAERGLERCPGRPELVLVQAEALIATQRGPAAEELLTPLVEAEGPSVGRALTLLALLRAGRGDTFGASLRAAAAAEVLALKERDLGRRLEELEARLGSKEEE